MDRKCQNRVKCQFVMLCAILVPVVIKAMYCLKAIPIQTMIDSMLCIPKIKSSTWHH
jgi:hypothetical protein